MSTNKDWQEKPFGEITQNFDALRKPVKEADRKAGSYPYYGASGVIDGIDSYIFEGEYLLVAEDGENLRSRKTPIAFIANGKFWVNNHAHIVQGNIKADTRFLMYALAQANIDAYLTGSTIPKLTQENLNRIPINLPSLTEQRAIAHILGALDKKIEINRQLNETLETMARVIFKAWFVDFDPIRAKFQGHQPFGTDAEVAALFPSSFEDSNLGEIPRGWQFDKFSTMIELIGGGTPKTSINDYWNGDIPWFSVVDVPNEGNVFVIDTDRKITQKGLVNSSTRLLAPGTTIITARGTVGKCALVGNPMAMNQSCYAVRGKEGRGDYFTYFALRNLVSKLQQSSHGTIFDTITRETFDTIKVICPPIPLTLQFDKMVSSYLDKILLNQYESHTLMAIRDTLLPILLSGRVRVKDAEKYAEAHI